MEKYHATQLIVKAFQEKKIRFRVEQLGRQEEIQAGFQVDCGPFVTVRFISLDDDNDVAVRALGIVGGVPKEKRLRLLEACNEINCKRRFLKFVLDRDGDVNVEYDFLMRADDGCIGEMACEVFAITMHLIDKDYPLLMKAIYTDEPVCGEENLRMRERMARLQGKKADEENGEPSAEDDPAPEEGLAELLEGLDRLTLAPAYLPDFAAKVYKISTDTQGSRLTHLKVTGGALKVRMALPGGEKITQIRLYNGVKYQAVEEVPAGTIAAVTGLSQSYAGEGLGAEQERSSPLLEPVISCRVTLPEGTDPHTALAQLRQLEQEDPQLHLEWEEQKREIRVRLMGEIQREILQSVAMERFGLAIGFEEGSILYKETIAAPVEGIGHYEPLRHYAEVHLLMEPLPRGSGLRFESHCPTDKLDLNWQRLILTHLTEKTHKGVLTGAPITDMKITLIAGRAHQKHTEGGDFREATYRAVRQGLRMAESILLEPWCRFTLTVPAEQLGRALNDLQQREAETEPPELLPETATLRGTAALDALRDYPAEVLRYTRGRGRLSWEPDGYAPCRHPEEVIAVCGYDCDADTANTADSVFCSRGAGHTVRWDEVPGMAHIQTNVLKADEEPEEPAVTRQRSEAYRGSLLQDKELMRIFEMTYGPIKRRSGEALHTPKPTGNSPKPGKAAPPPEGPEYLLVDGYNIIFAWEELAELAKTDLDAARHRLIQILCNYQGYRRCELILVFDAYKVKGNPGSIERHHGISVVYTKEAETADMYIEKVTHTLAKEHRVRVATSDGLEQIIILGHGAIRVPARQFQEEVRQVEEAIREILENM